MSLYFQEIGDLRSILEMLLGRELYGGGALNVVAGIRQYLEDTVTRYLYPYNFRSASDISAVTKELLTVHCTFP